MIFPRSILSKDAGRGKVDLSISDTSDKTINKQIDHDRDRALATVPSLKSPSTAACNFLFVKE